MRLLDRYVLRTFLRAYAYCIAAFLVVWLVFDISDKISTYLDESVSLAAIARYYTTQMPEIIVIVLPISLLLAVLFTLSRMSRTNEIVSMLTAGVSIPRLLVPLFAVGIATAGVSAALNFSLAPHADQARRIAFQELRDEVRGADVTGQIFRNRTANRTWFIQRFRPGENSLGTIQVLQQDEADNIVTNYMAASASYSPAAGTWELRDAKVVHYDNRGNITHEEIAPSFVIREWDETPYRLASSNMRPDFLSVPELREYLRFNADFPPSQLAPFETHLHYRIALPWNCLVFVLLAAPLGIGFSRKGVLTGVAVAIGLAFAMNFLTHLFLALGEGNRIPASVAGWTPNLLFATLGLALLYFRATNREAREFNPFLTRALATA